MGRVLSGQPPLIYNIQNKLDFVATEFDLQAMLLLYEVMLKADNSCDKIKVVDCFNKINLKRVSYDQ